MPKILWKEELETEVLRRSWLLETILSSCCGHILPNTLLPRQALALQNKKRSWNWSSPSCALTIPIDKAQPYWVEKLETSVADGHYYVGELANSLSSEVCPRIGEAYNVSGKMEGKPRGSKNCLDPSGVSGH